VHGKEGARFGGGVDVGDAGSGEAVRKAVEDGLIGSLATEGDLAELAEPATAERDEERAQHGGSAADVGAVAVAGRVGERGGFAGLRRDEAAAGKRSGEDHLEAGEGVRLVGEEPAGVEVLSERGADDAAEQGFEGVMDEFG
jgi:hypothetical protein